MTAETWKPTHIVDGIEVMVYANDMVVDPDSKDLDASIGAYTADEWGDGVWPFVRRMPDGRWLSVDGDCDTVRGRMVDGRWIWEAGPWIEDVTDHVTEITR